MLVPIVPAPQELLLTKKTTSLLKTSNSTYNKYYISTSFQDIPLNDADHTYKIISLSLSKSSYYIVDYSSCYLINNGKETKTTDQLVAASLFSCSFKVGLCTVTPLGVASGRPAPGWRRHLVWNAKQNFSVFLPVWPKLETTHGGNAWQSRCSKCRRDALSGIIN